MTFLRDTIASLLGETPWTEDVPDLMGGDVLSDILPWRSYDAEKELYHCAHGSGFLMEVGSAGGGDQLVRDLSGVLISSMPSNGTLQILNWTSPTIGPILKGWSGLRMGKTPLIDEMVRHRVQHLFEQRFGGEATGVRAMPFDRRILVAAWLDGEVGLQEESALRELRAALENVFTVTSAWCESVKPRGFLSFVRELLHAARANEDSLGGADDAYEENMPLNFQLPGATLKVSSQALEMSGTPQISATVQSINAYPKEWTFGMGSVLQGNPAKMRERPIGPVLTSFVLKAMSGVQAGSLLLKKRGKSEHASNTSFSKFIPNFAEKKSELDRLAAEVDSGERLFETLYTVTSYARGGPAEAQAAARAVESMYRAASVRLSRDTYLQLPLFIASLPFGCSHAMMKDFSRQMRMRLLKTQAGASFVPVHGEWGGNSRGAGLLLTGRQGQVFQFDNFRSPGNYNVSVIGKSGSGKSVFMQEMAVGIYSAGGAVLVIDDGYSFQNTCEVLEGKHIAFDGSRDIRLNPFSLLDQDAMAQEEYRSDAIELITNVVASMADLGKHNEGRVQGVEEDFIRSAIARVWDEKGRAGEISQVRDILRTQQENDPRLPDIVRKLDAYADGGAYGGYFKGEANIELDSPFTVVELSDIKGQKGLEATILQIVMFLGSELRFKTPRAQPVAIIIDEAWDLLKGEGTARFIEGVVRRARKYIGALITGTQSMRDYAANEAAKVCLENSDFRVYLAQKPESVEALNLSTGISESLNSLTSVPGHFSELAISMPDGWGWGRLMLDPYSLAVFSSKGTTVARIKALRADGHSFAEAISQLVEEGGAL